MSNSNASSLVLDAAKAQNIIASRSLVKRSQVGETFRFHVQGNGNIIPVRDKEGNQVMSSGTDLPLYKTIYNIKANSHVAMLSVRNQAILREAMKAETDGDMETAHTKFNEYLNKIQVSFSVIINPGREPQKFYDKQLIEGEIELVTTDNGELLTISNPRAVAVAKLGATPAFTLEDLMGVDPKTPETVFTETGATEGAGAEKADA